MTGAVAGLLALLGLGFGPGAVFGVALLLAAWYVTVARRAELPAWGFTMIPVVAALGLLSWQLAQATAGRPQLLWLLWVGFGALTAGSHLGEPLQPPRTFQRDRWSEVGDYLRGPPRSGRALGRRLAYMGWVTFAGLCGELWAAQRLLPYNLLFLMFRAGYAPDVCDRLHDRVERARASGNPALDFVGIGGAAQLRVPPRLDR